MTAPGRPKLEAEQVVFEEGYESALRDVLLEFERVEKAVGAHAQPDYWFGAKQVVRTLMCPKNADPAPTEPAPSDDATPDPAPPHTGPDAPQEATP